MKRFLWFIGVLLAACAHQPLTSAPPVRKIFKIFAFPHRSHGGTAFLVRSDSGRTYVLTNAHVCEKTQQNQMFIEIQLNEFLVVKILKMDFANDLCLLEWPHPYKGFKLARDWPSNRSVTVIGYPKLQILTRSSGRILQFANIPLINFLILPKHSEASCLKIPHHTVEWTVVNLTMRRACVMYLKGMRLSVFIRPGSSGSPVFDLNGNVIGIIAGGNAKKGTGFAVTFTQIRRFLKEL